MALITALKGALMFLGVIALLIFVVICGEMALLIILYIRDEIRSRRDRGGREWWDR